MIAPRRATTSPEEALELLMAGNRRWVEGNLAHPNRSVDRRGQLAEGQAPFATVFSCIDSRVPAEIVFDCGLGDLAVVRTGAHVLDEGPVLGSLLFAAGELGTPLVLVLGHQRCGAVTAARDVLEREASPEPGLEAVVELLRPAYEATRDRNLDDVDEMVKAQTRLTVERLTASLPPWPSLKVVGGYYSLDTGAVSILD
jgi:carbonic anhydrase